ncbi:hypothetical protein ACFYNO_22655 [Kitasatospora sp. NPDC006697]|uniref:hypothetical protein n=1 Tax=Kitasatospora sp. NPDC006697 TaxID=3364020 RepID=UPI00368D9B19
MSATVILTGSVATATVTSSAPAQAVVPPGVYGSTAAPMGWNSWYFYNNGYTAQNIADAAAGLAAQNGNLPVNGSGNHESMADLGYKDVGMDGGWWTNGTAGRDANGNPVPNAGFLTGYRTKAVTLSNGTVVPSVTLNSMSDLTGYIHSLGLYAGIYSDTGAGAGGGCGGQNGSGNHEAGDVTTFATWGFDWLKLDHCGGVPTSPNYTNTMEGYKYWGSLLANARTSAGTAHPMALEICEWGEGSPDGPWAWGGAAARTARTGRDISGAAGYGTTTNGGATWINWSQVWNNFQLNDHPSNQAAGQYNDPDYLLIGPGFGDNPSTGAQQTHGTDPTLWGLTPDEKQSYFGMWAIQGAPLVLGTDVTSLDPTTLGVIGNQAVIGVDQDSAAHQGQKVLDNGTVQTWSKQLSGSGNRAVLLLNTSGGSSTYTFTTQGLDLTGTSTVSNLYTGANLGTLASGGSLSFTLAPHQSVMLKLTGGADAKPETVLATSASGLGQKTWNGSSWSGWQNLNLGTTGTGPVSIQGNPAVVNSPSGTDVFVRGADNALWVDSYLNGTWGSWTSLGGTLSDSPTAASIGQDRIDVFVRGTDGAVFQKTYQQAPGTPNANQSCCPAYWPSVSWTSSWTDLLGPATTSSPNTIVGAPTAVASLNRVDLFARGADNALWQKSYVSGVWSNWTSLGGTLNSAPVAASGGPGQIDVFATKSDNTVSTLGWTAAGGWASSWSSVGTQTVTGTPSAAEVGSRANVYARGTDNTLWQAYRSGSSWVWQQLDSTRSLTGSPAAAGRL